MNDINEIEDERVFLEDGGDWADHEDCIVGNELGLRNLRRAIDSALEEGEYSGRDLGQWLGVKRIDPDALRDLDESPMGPFSKVAAIAIVLVFLAAIGVGIWTILGWIFG